MRSSMSSAGSSGTLSSTVRTMYPTRSSGLTSTSDPLPARPIGDLPVATITASVTGRGYEDALTSERGRHPSQYPHAGKRPDPVVRAGDARKGAIEGAASRIERRPHSGAAGHRLQAGQRQRHGLDPAAPSA